MRLARDPLFFLAPFLGGARAPRGQPLVLLTTNQENELGLPGEDCHRHNPNTRAAHASMDGRSRALLALLIATTDGLQRTIRLPGKRCAALGATGPSWAHDGVSHRAFGVEIELLSDDVDDLADAVARAGEDVIIANTVTRVTTKAWKIVPDLSLPYDCGFELVSPILRGQNGRRRLVNVMNQIDDESYVNVQCGLHVHVDLTDIKFAGVRRICQNWVSTKTRSTSSFLRRGAGTPIGSVSRYATTAFSAPGRTNE